MRCVILGGGGFLGSHLSKALIINGVDVRIFDRPEARYLEYSRQQGVTVFTGDFFNPEDVIQAISDCDLVYHLISTTVPQTSIDDPYSDVKTNVLGTLRLLEAMRKAEVKKIVFISSGGTVYGIPQEIPIKEDHPTEPISSYGICKLTIEKYLHLYWKLYGLDYSILRVANAYGERQPVQGTQGVIGVFLDQAFHNSEIMVWGDGSVVRDYIYAGDIVSAFIKVGTYTGGPRVFNIGAGQGYSVNEIINIIGQVIQRPLEIKNMPGRVFDIPINVLDISLAKKVLNWQPTVGIMEGISRTYEWIRKEEED
jgi:UDP-glucose 4-epimerase